MFQSMHIRQSLFYGKNNAIIWRSSTTNHSTINLFQQNGNWNPRWGDHCHQCHVIWFKQYIYPFIYSVFFFMFCIVLSIASLHWLTPVFYPRNKPTAFLRCYHVRRKRKPDWSEFELRATPLVRGSWIIESSWHSAHLGQTGRKDEKVTKDI